MSVQSQDIKDLSSSLVSNENVMLQMKDLTKIYPTPTGDYVVLEDLQLKIMKEEFVSIIGHSGCGKTTLLTMIAGLNDISGGDILLNDSPILGRNVGFFDTSRIARCTFGNLGQRKNNRYPNYTRCR